MKKMLLRNMWVVALALVPATMARSVYVSAAEIPCAAEEARLTGTVVRLADFRRKIEGMTKA